MIFPDSSRFALVLVGVYFDLGWKDILHENLYAILMFHILFYHPSFITEAIKENYNVDRRLKINIFIFCFKKTHKDAKKSILYV